MAKSGRPTRSLRKAIDNKCKDCVYDPANKGTWRQQVEACDIESCPLWPVRPTSRGEKDVETTA